MIATIPKAVFAALGGPTEPDFFPAGAVVGVEAEVLVAAGGGGGWTMSATLRTGAGASAGGITSAGTRLSREPGCTGKMEYDILASRLEQGLPA
ncbi:hypothetical protein Acr_13g0010320 [Actinidia rufa]|uniref:Uncharacterized protein n=1 Tax=Actinidia rufa TaxID=165716 RepID=A0A7J0FLN1_9ERIC|nr:hypothetical protein Acr_13g0010320 [Actinidia rufa]